MPPPPVLSKTPEAGPPLNDDPTPATSATKLSADRFERLAIAITNAKVANPFLELWLDSHPSAGSPGTVGTEAMAMTIASGAEDASTTQLVETLSGVTTNPNLIAAYDRICRREGHPRIVSDEDRYAHYIASAAATMEQRHQSSGARFGWVSAQVSPRHSFSAHAIVAEGLRLARIAPNVMVKVPGTAQGYEAIRTLVANGVSVNGTLSYSLAQFRAFGEAVSSARADLSDRENDTVRTVVTHMAGRVGDAFDTFHGSDDADSSTYSARFVESALARQGVRMLQAIEPRSTLLLSSLRVDLDAEHPCAHLTSVVDLPAACTLKPSVIGSLARTDLARVFTASTTLNAALDSWDGLAEAPALLRPLFNPDLTADEFWTLPPFLQTHAEASASQFAFADGRAA